MITMELSCILTGKNFSPALAERLIGHELFEKNESGEIARVGRYKGLPFPYGSCTIRDDASLKVVVDFLEKNQAELFGNGVEDIVLQLNVTYEGQCNFELDPLFLSRVAKLSQTLSISCY